MRRNVRGTQRLAIRLRLALEPECLENPKGHRQGISQEMERTLSETLKLFVVSVSDIERRSVLLSSTRARGEAAKAYERVAEGKTRFRAVLTM